jgi:glycosyltransferase involved in cell wall biosynthesis
MAVWYDVSDLTSWTLPHLTGIQRTTVGILNGLVASGARPQLVRFCPQKCCFLPIKAVDLPEAILGHLPWVERAPSAESTTSAAVGEHVQRAAAAEETAGRRWRLISRDQILGASPASLELRQSFRTFRQSSNQLQRNFFRWARFRYRGHKQAPPAVISSSTTSPQRPPQPPLAGPFQRNDLLLSLGATWAIAGHAEAVAAARKNGTSVVRTIYDLIPVIKPEWVLPQHVPLVTKWARNVLRESDAVLTISEFSKQEIKKYCDELAILKPPLKVIRLGDELPSAGDETPALPRFVPRRPFFLCVSTLDVRKNHRLLYDVWNSLASRDPDGCPDLVCMGVKHLFVSELVYEIYRNRAVNGKIHILENIADSELSWYYRHCAATIYPSRYEGWGLPVAESLGHGRLCLASDATSIPEISRDLPVFFDPLDAKGLMQLVQRTLQDPEWVREREAAIRSRFRVTSWRDTAGQVLAAAGIPESRQVA